MEVHLRQLETRWQDTTWDRKSKYEGQKNLNYQQKSHNYDINMKKSLSIVTFYHNVGFLTHDYDSYLMT